MPSAQTVVSKPEKSVVQDISEPCKTFLAIIEKKVRNLEKRKEKLDGYKKLLASGESLNDDQKKAVACYPDVISSLNLAHEFSKQFSTLLVDFEKQEKKRKKREAIEKSQQAAGKIREVLIAQDVLDNMSFEVRRDFLEGKNGACKLTEEQLKHLDDFFHLINPREEVGEKDFQACLTSSAEHLSNMLESKPKDVVGTTYKELNEVIFKIADSKYLEPKNVEAQPEPEPETVEHEALVEEVEAVEVPCEPELEVTPEMANGHPEEKVEEQLAVPTGVDPKGIETTLFYRSDAGSAVPEAVHLMSASAPVVIPRVPVIPAPSDVISDVQKGGAFNFIQESELESPLSHPVNVDPAVMMVAPQSYPIAPYVSLAGVPAVPYGIPVTLGSGHRPPSPPPQIPLPTREEMMRLEAQKLEEQRAMSEMVKIQPEEPLMSNPENEPPVIDNWSDKPESPKEESNVWKTKDKPRERGGFRGGRGDRGDYRGRGRGDRREGYLNGRGGGRGRDERYYDRGNDGYERNYERRERNFEDKEQGYGDRDRYYDRNSGERGRGGFRGGRGGNRGGESRGRGGYGNPRRP
ncbi:caprin-1-like isoform X2 [Artemia franciscana]|uniref:caprin-1-like isoform X2 n=1 Tax=Artemia franciscana TaxID=6661 RepID=UPI0032DA4FD4